MFWDSLPQRTPFDLRAVTKIRKATLTNALWRSGRTLETEVGFRRSEPNKLKKEIFLPLQQDGGKDTGMMSDPT
jgi:hypothetical protein